MQVPPPTVRRPLWAGTLGPRPEHPPRRPGSWRRTVTLDIVVSDDVRTLTMAGAGRDLWTGREGEVQVLASASLAVSMPWETRVLDHVAAAIDGEAVDLSALSGSNASAGFRRALAGLGEDAVPAGHVLAQLLDDIPVGAVIAGFSLSRRDVPEHQPGNRPGGGGLPFDVCAGWASGGSMALSRIGESDFDFSLPGPAAQGPELDPADPLAWHAVPPMPAGAMRRRRRSDVTWADDGSVAVDTWFRDTHGERDGTECVVHEYDVPTSIGPDRVVRSIAATPRVLPAPECPQAGDSAGRLVGAGWGAIRDLVRSSFSGPATCTHLNDLLRSIGLLEQAVPAADLTLGKEPRNA